ncbi:MAG: methylated-DNA--[protein]-cysteine S-methyltransferase [Clostridia bacterium]
MGKNLHDSNKHRLPGSADDIMMRGMSAMDVETKEFYGRIYSIAMMIPKGRVASYGQLAMMAGVASGARMAGRAMKDTPSELDIPCHRVVNSNGCIAPDYVFDGKRNQRAMLEAEGVVFLPNGNIDMKMCRWNPSD